MIPWPRSLFGRLALLLLMVLVIAIAVTILLFRQDRAALLARQFGDTKIVQLQSLRAALGAVELGERRDTLRRIGREYDVRILPERQDRPMFGAAPTSPVLSELEARLLRALGDGTALRVQPRLQLLWVRLQAGDAGYWVGFPLPRRPQGEDTPSRAAIWSLTIAAALVLAAFLFARYLARPLRQLDEAAQRVALGEMPSPLPESGPSEIAHLNRGFNRMLTSLRKLEQDRALLLAGVSHDLRTPLARLRLGLEMGVGDAGLKRGMIDDIEDMDRIIGQFLDFARSEQDIPLQMHDPDPIVAAAVERYARAGQAVTFRPGPAERIPVRPTALSRVVANLVDNALAYGAPPVEVTTRQVPGRFVLEVADRGPGIPPADVERLKQPFTRVSTARTNTAGVAGAGLGLAIVDRIAGMHGGSFALVPRQGGGTVARVELPSGPTVAAP